MQIMESRGQLKAWIIWIIAAGFYAFEFFIRISPTVMVNDLMRDFAVDAAIVGNLSALYYYAYASMQIPAGLLLDRYGIRPLLTVAAGLVALGSLLFATAHHLLIAEIGRVCMGIGSAFSFISCLKLARNWFAERQLAVVIGLTNTLGIIGALGGEAPLALSINHLGWRNTMLIAGIMGFLLACIIYFFIKDHPRVIGYDSNMKKEKQSFSQLWQNIKPIFSCRRTWLTAIYGCLMVAPISAFTELWSVPFFMQVDHLTRTTAAGISSLVFIGIGVGGPFHGWLSGKIGQRKPVMLFGAISAFICFVALIYLPYRYELLPSILLFLFGFFTSSMLLAFSINAEHNPAIITGLVVGFTNMVVMLGGTIFQPFVGYLLDDFSPVTHATQFNLYAYQHALVVLPVCQLIAIVLIFFIRETFCRKF